MSEIVCEICGWSPSVQEPALLGLIGPLPEMFSHALAHCFPEKLVETRDRYREIVPP